MRFTSFPPAAAIAFGTAVFAAAITAERPALAKEAAALTSACKGLSSTACAAKSDACSWIKATTLKNGKTRKAYCRKKASGSAKKS